MAPNSAIKLPLARELYDIECAGNSRPNWSLANFESELLSDESRVFRWQKDENEGFILYRLVVEEVWIMNIAVKHKGQGFGSLLVKQFIASLAGGVVQRILLEVSRSNTAAKALYQKIGFQKIGERKNYYPDGSDAWVMAYEATSI
jgi:ribosomal-protein-alanine N-acetyltransferase